MSPSGPATLHIPPVQRGITGAIAIFAVVNMLLLGGMRAFLNYYRALPDWNEAPPIKNLYTQVNLATENVVASWYSSMLLLLASLIAVLCFGVDQACRRGKLAGGWLLVAAIFLLLSFDEMGSLHERAGMLGILNPFGEGGLGWVTVLAIPIMAVVIYLAAFGWMRIRGAPHALWLFGAGLLLLAANPGMEIIEMRYLLDESESSLRTHDLWVLFEEGTELFAFLLLSLSLVTYAASVSRSCGRWQVIIPPGVLRAIAITVVCGLAAVLFVAGLVNTYLAEGDIGQPANWPPSALACLNAIVLLLVAGTRSRGKRALLIGAAVFCLLVSVFHGACMKFWLASFVHEVNLGLTVAAVALALPFLPAARWSARVGISAAVLVFAVALRAHPYHGGYLDVLSQGVLLVVVLESQTNWQRAANLPSDRAPDRKNPPMIRNEPKAGHRKCCRQAQKSAPELA